MIDRLKDNLDDFPDLVAFIEGVEFFQKETISKLKAKVRLFDGSTLWVREIWDNNRLEAYSYYWLRSDETLIIGWDNAPHHKSVETYPHHKHIRNSVEPSTQTNLGAVLSFIQDFFK